MFTMKQEAKNQNNKTESHVPFFSHLSLSMHRKNMQSSWALFISLSLLKHESKDKACKEYLPKPASKYTKALTTGLTQ